jgi:hypothetical protein
MISMAEDLADGMKMWSLSAQPWRTVAVFERRSTKHLSKALEIGVSWMLMAV